MSGGSVRKRSFAVCLCPSPWGRKKKSILRGAKGATRSVDFENLREVSWRGCVKKIVTVKTYLVNNASLYGEPVKLF